MKSFLLTSILATALLLFISCNTTDPIVEKYKFPLSEGNQWIYEIKSTYSYSWNAEDTIQVDTLEFKILSEDTATWYKASTIKTSLKIADTTYFSIKNGSLGTEVLPLNNILGLFVNSSVINPDDTLASLMLPINNDVMPYKQGEIDVEEGNDTTITDGAFNSHFCKQLISIKDHQIKTYTFYNDSGIIAKVFTPDTIVAGADTVIINKVIELTSNTLN